MFHQGRSDGIQNSRGHVRIESGFGRSRRLCGEVRRHQEGVETTPAKKCTVAFSSLQFALCRLARLHCA